MGEKPAYSGKRKPKRKKWDKVVSCAYLRLLGATQKRAAKEVGCSERSIRNWEGAPWWSEAEEEARDRWLKGGDQAAMRGILRNLGKAEPQTCRWWADRRVPELAPPSKRIAGPDGGPLQVQVDAIDPRLRDMSDERLLELEAEIEAAIEKAGGHDSSSA